MQVAQPIILNIENEENKLSEFLNNNNEYDEDEFESLPDSENLNRVNNNNNNRRRNTAYSHVSQFYKYRVSSDREMTHILSLYVQGQQDEGSYQCIDSKSESPIKKTIRVHLSKLI